MRRLNEIEDNALLSLRKRGSFCPGLGGSQADDIRRVLDGLVKVKLARTEDTDDGPRYSLTARGEWEAEAVLRERAGV